MKDKFEKPMMQKINFEAEDIIVTSGECTSKCSGDCLSVCSGNCYHICDNDCQVITS